MKTIYSKCYLDTARGDASNASLDEALKRHFPSYLSEPASFCCSSIWYCCHCFLQWLIQLGIRLVLRPRKESGDTLNPQEVDDVYDREAATYDRKHHLTTRGQDTMWRRFAGWQVAAMTTTNRNPLTILDLCTGTGLTVEEMAGILSCHSITATIVGLDRNDAMLSRAGSRCQEYSGIALQFVRGDATSLVENNCVKDDGMARFASRTFDAAVQVFGIGGISEPLRVFEEVLAVLKEGGRFILVDMHAPIASQPGEWPMLLKWLRTPMLEALTYQRTTIPLALRRLWAWRDTTLDFYLLPLVTWHDQAVGSWWGYEVISRTVESERWWLSLPIMPVGRLVVCKARLSQEEAKHRQDLLAYAQSIVVS